MASARARLSAARSSIIGRQKKADIASGIVGTVGTVAGFLGGQLEKAKTAWDEYETGYEELVGEKPTDKRGWFKGPEGDVRVGEKMYNREDIRKVGALLGTDTASLLFADEDAESIRTKYLEKAAPGTLVTGDDLGDWLQSDEYREQEFGTNLATPLSVEVSDRRKVPAFIQKKRDAAEKLKESRFQDFQSQLNIKRQDQIDKENKAASWKMNYEIQQDELMESLSADPTSSLRIKERFQEQIDKNMLEGPQFSKSQQRKMDTALSKWQESRHLDDDSSLGIHMSGEDYDKLVYDRQQAYYRSLSPDWNQPTSDFVGTRDIRRDASTPYSHIPQSIEPFVDGISEPEYELSTLNPIEQQWYEEVGTAWDKGETIDFFLKQDWRGRGKEIARRPDAPRVPVASEDTFFDEEDTSIQDTGFTEFDESIWEKSRNTLDRINAEQINKLESSSRWYRSGDKGYNPFKTLDETYENRWGK